MSKIEHRLRASMRFGVLDGSAEERGILECQIEEAIRELATLRARAEAAERERDEARAELALLTEERNRLRAALRLAYSGIRVYRQSTPCSSDHRPGDLYEECRGCGFEVILETVRAALAGEGERIRCDRCLRTYTAEGEGPCWCGGTRRTEKAREA